MKKITLTDKRKSNYYYNEAIKIFSCLVRVSKQFWLQVVIRMKEKVM